MKPRAGPSRDTGPQRPLRLLVITYHFPPDAAVGGLRWGSILKYLGRQGWPVEVIAGGEVERPRVVSGTRVHTVRRARTLNDLYRRVRGQKTQYGPGSGEGRTTADRTQAPTPLQRLRTALGAVMAYPSHARGWLHRAGVVARRVIRRRGVDVVVTSGPPHIAHTVGLLATVGTDVRWVIDLRDPWSGQLKDSTPVFLDWLTRQLERMAFHRCECLVANTLLFAESLRRNYPEKEVYWIPNGIDLEGLPQRVPPTGETISIAYAGTLYLGRDFEPVLRAMQRLSGEGTGARRVRLRFAGHTDPTHLARLHHQMREYGIGEDQVEILGPVPREEARAMAQRAHLALVLAQEQPLQVPAKLYELAGMGVPTLVLTEPGSASATEAERIGAIWKTPYDIEGIAGVIERAGREPSTALSIAAERFDYEHISRRMAEVLAPERRP